jgi:hypothetical protein
LAILFVIACSTNVKDLTLPDPKLNHGDACAVERAADALTVDGLTPNRAAVAFGMKVVLAEAFAERDFEGPAVVDIVAGRVPMMFLGLSISGPQVTSGKFHALAVIYRSADLYGKWN